MNEEQKGAVNLIFMNLDDIRAEILSAEKRLSEAKDSILYAEKILAKNFCEKTDYFGEYEEDIK